MNSSVPHPLTSSRSGPLSGRCQVPGDKSISHRSLLLGALAAGRTRIRNLLEGEDILNTAKAVTELGAPATKSAADWQVLGRGTGGLSAPTEPLDFGNSGTGVRLMMGVVAGHDMEAGFTGDASLCRRPMARVLTPLRKMGAEVVEGGPDLLPLRLRGSSRLKPIEYLLPVPSAQVKSAILLAGLHAPGETTVLEKEATRDHTERMLRFFGATVRVEERGDLRAITVRGDAELEGREIVVPGDPSSAAFLAAAATIVPGSEVLIEGVLVNPTRTGFYTTLLEMGADIAFLDEREECGERVADIRVRSSRLKGVGVPAARAPTMIDEYPVLAVVSAFADGETHMEGLAELKAKESDRLAVTAALLTGNGVAAKVEGDRMTVAGASQVRGGGLVETRMDHRIAMAGLTLGLATDRPVTIDDEAYIATSFPQFRGLMERLGARFTPGVPT